MSPSQASAPEPLARALTLSLLVMAALSVLLKPVSMTDLSVYMKMGEWMVAHSRLMEEEVYAFTELGRVWVNGTWLAQVLFYLGWRAGGYPLLQLLHAVAVAGTFALLAVHGRRRGGREVLASLAVAWAFSLALWNLGLRPQTLVMPLFAATWLVADQFAERRWAPFALGGIFALWPNLHGAFPAGLAIVFAVTGGAALSRWRADGWRAIGADRRVRRLVLLSGVSLAATALNPYGPGIWGYVLVNTYLPGARHLDEWLPAAPLSYHGIRLILSLAVVVLALALRRRREGDFGGWLRLEDVLVLAAFAFLAVGSRRMILWWGLASAPVVAGFFGGREPVPVRQPGVAGRWVQRGTWVFLGLVLLAANPWIPKRGVDRVTAEGFTSVGRTAPVAAIEALLAREGGGRVFNRMMWGSYLIWRGWPRYAPYIDPRIWVFGDDTWETYLDVSNAWPGWEDHLDRWEVEVLLLDPHVQQPLFEAARASPGWRVVYADRHSAVLERARPDQAP